MLQKPPVLTTPLSCSSLGFSHMYVCPLQVVINFCLFSLACLSFVNLICGAPVKEPRRTEEKVFPPLQNKSQSWSCYNFYFYFWKYFCGLKVERLSGSSVLSAAIQMPEFLFLYLCQLERMLGPVPLRPSLPLSDAWTLPGARKHRQRKVVELITVCKVPCNPWLNETIEMQRILCDFICRVSWGQSIRQDLSRISCCLYYCGLKSVHFNVPKM